MFSKLFWLLILVGLIYWRQQKAKQPLKKVYTEEFDGEVIQVGESYIGVREARRKVKRSVICMHGFMENMLYLRKLYDQDDTQLILLNNSGYHAPIEKDNYETPDWAILPPFNPGTIEYDAFILNQALENLPKSKNIRIHGHSRGGAVTIEAIATRPDLHRKRNIEYILEAPILPRALPALPCLAMFNPVAQFFIPFTFSLLRDMPDEKRATFFAGKKPGYKRDFLNNTFFNPKSFSIIDRNIFNMYTWSNKRKLSTLQEMPDCKLYIASNDTILYSGHMRKIASLADWLEPIECKGSHWQAFDNPQLFVDQD